MAAAVEQENAEILPLDRYIRAVTICNNLALLASQGSVAQFFQRIAVLSRLQRYWTKGFDTVELSCAEVDALPPDTDEDDDDACGLASLVPVSSAADWDARSDSTVDLKPDISSVVTDVSEAVDVHLALEQNDGAKDDGDEEYRLPAKKHRRRKVKRFSCQQCGEKFTYRYQLTRHENRSHKQAPGDAAAADAVPASGEEPRCKRRRRGRPRGSYRNRTVHKWPRTRPKVKTEIDASAETKLLNQFSATTHADRKHMCNVCGRQFRTSAMLVVHMRIHTGERPYVCEVPGCDKRFAQASGLQYHTRTHSDATPYICSDCGRQFRHPGLLSAHLLVHAGIRRFRCDECGASFLMLTHLRRHQRVHSSEQPFACSKCPVRFKFSWGLRRHERAMHLGEKPFVCSVCDKAFAEIGNLRTHIRTHTGERPFVCCVCNQRFTQSSSMKTHMRLHNIGNSAPPEPVMEPAEACV